MININIFGGPGSGKSTTAAGLFYKMKTNDMVVEYVQEYAKDLTYGQDNVKLSDQILLLGEQHHRLFRLKDEVDFIIHDSPFVVGAVYANELLVPISEYLQLVKALYDRYEHINFLLKRNPNSYQEYGRIQTLDESINIDNNIEALLSKYNIPYHIIEIGENAVDEIYNKVKEMK